MSAQSGVPIISDLAPSESEDGSGAAYMRDVQSSLVVRFDPVDVLYNLDSVKLILTRAR